MLPEKKTAPVRQHRGTVEETTTTVMNEGVSMSTLPEVSSPIVRDFHSDLSPADAAVVRETATREVQRCLADVQERHGLHPWVGIEVAREGFARHRADWEDVARADEFTKAEMCEVLEKVTATITTKGGARIASLYDLVADAGSGLIVDITNTANTVLAQSFSITESRIIDIATHFVTEAQADTEPETTTYALVEAVGDGEGRSSKLNVALLYDDRGCLVSIEPAGIELTADQAIALAEALVLAAGELRTQAVAL